MGKEPIKPSGHSREPAKRKRVMVVDGHPIVREHLAEAVAREPDLAFCGEAEDCYPALELVEAKSPHLVIVELSLRSSHGLDLIKDLRIRHPEIATLVFSMHDESILAERSLRAGARGYITKQEPTKKVIAAVRTVLEGGIYLSESLALKLASKVVRNPSANPKSSVDLLTDRELRVFQLLGKGWGTRRIAEQLKLHITTIETYRARIKEKLELKDADELRQQAISWTQRNV